MLVISGNCWLSVIIVRYQWLLLVISGYCWLSVIIFGYQWLSLVISNSELSVDFVVYSWLVSFISGYRWLLLVISCYCWLSVVILGYQWLLLVISGYSWLSVVIVGYQWLFLVNSNLRASVTALAERGVWEYHMGHSPRAHCTSKAQVSLGLGSAGVSSSSMSQTAGQIAAISSS